MDKYVKLYRQLSPDDKTWRNNKSYLKYAPKIFKGKELKEILKFATKNIEECEVKRAKAKKELLDLVATEEKHNFKSHCVMCGRMIVPVDDPRKPAEYEARGNYCDYCHSKSNKWAKKDFYGGTISSLLELFKGKLKPKKEVVVRVDLKKGRKIINSK